MLMSKRVCCSILLGALPVSILAGSSPFAQDPGQPEERTCFQTSQPWSPSSNLRSDVAIVYGIDPGLPKRIESWREHGYRIHVMTGVAWGNYQDYLYARFDGINHEDEAQTERDGKKISHGGDVYYMCPGTNYGRFLSVGVQRALEAGAEAIHLEEPEFWVRGGYSEGFKREWKTYYGEDWLAPHTSVDAQWRASKLKYFLYRRALQQVFDHIQDFNKKTGKHVRCYVPTHSLLNYAQWRIVSPESSLARLNGCDGYIAQVWTGTARTPNQYRGRVAERTFESAFLEYGMMQNLVRSTGRRVWYLNDPVEDNPDHDWGDYQRNWESTLTASMFQSDVSRYEVAPWPERIFAGKYPKQAKRSEREGIPPAYATELQTVMNAMHDMDQKRVEWDCGTAGIGVLASDSLMFQRGDPEPGDTHFGNFFGLALPLLKRGSPVMPLQLENLTIPKYLDGLRVLLLTYQGQKPLSPDVHASLAQWVKRGGALVFVDDDSDPYNRVREWWNNSGTSKSIPREHLFQQLGVGESSALASGQIVPSGKGCVAWIRQSPIALARSKTGDATLIDVVKTVSARMGIKWRETNYLILRRGPYIVAAGMDESTTDTAKQLDGKFINLFDSTLSLTRHVSLTPGSRYLLLDLNAVGGPATKVLASAGRSLEFPGKKGSLRVVTEGVGGTQGILLLRSPKPPRSIRLDGQSHSDYLFSAEEQLLRVKVPHQARPCELEFEF